MASDPLYAEDEMELTSSEINLPHNLDEMASPKESTSNMSSLNASDCCDTGTKINFLISSQGLFLKVITQKNHKIATFLLDLRHFLQMCKKIAA